MLQMCFRLFVSLTAMSFLWVGSQIPLYLYGSVLPLIYSDLGGANGRYLWMVIGYLIPVSALCPFVGALSDLFGRRPVAMFGQLLLIIGPIVVATAHNMNTAIGEAGSCTFTVWRLTFSMCRWDGTCRSWCWVERVDRPGWHI